MPFSSTSQFSIGAAASGIPDKPSRLEAEALLCSLDHGPCRADLGLANSAGGFDIKDDTGLHVNEILVGVSEECRPLVRSGPLGRRIGWRDELRHNVAGGNPCHIIDGCQILLHCAARPLGIATSVPVRPRDRALLVGIGSNQAASTAKPSPPTSPAAIHASTTRSNTRRKTSPSRKRSLRARENAE
jgi:hypothetical protein